MTRHYEGDLVAIRRMVGVVEKLRPARFSMLIWSSPGLWWWGGTACAGWHLAKSGVLADRGLRLPFNAYPVCAGKTGFEALEVALGMTGMDALTLFGPIRGRWETLAPPFTDGVAITPAMFCREVRARYPLLAFPFDLPSSTLRDPCTMASAPAGEMELVT